MREVDRCSPSLFPLGMFGLFGLAGSLFGPFGSVALCIGGLDQVQARIWAGVRKLLKLFFEDSKLVPPEFWVRESIEWYKTSNEVLLTLDVCETFKDIDSLEQRFMDGVSNAASAVPALVSMRTV